MSAENICKISQLKVINNGGCNARIRLVTFSGNTTFLTPDVKSQETIIFDLTKLEPVLNNGDTFQLEAIFDTGGGVIDQTQFTYDKDSQSQGVFVIKDTANAPFISFSNLAPIE